MLFLGNVRTNFAMKLQCCYYAAFYVCPQQSCIPIHLYYAFPSKCMCFRSQKGSSSSHLHVTSIVVYFDIGIVQSVVHFTATQVHICKGCSQSPVVIQSSSPVHHLQTPTLVVWLHMLSLHNSNNATRICNHTVTSNPETDVSTTVMSGVHSLMHSCT